MYLLYGPMLLQGKAVKLDMCAQGTQDILLIRGGDKTDSRGNFHSILRAQTGPIEIILYEQMEWIWKSVEFRNCAICAPQNGAILLKGKAVRSFRRIMEMYKVHRCLADQEKGDDKQDCSN